MTTDTLANFRWYWRNQHFCSIYRDIELQKFFRQFNRSALSWLLMWKYEETLKDLSTQCVHCPCCNTSLKNSTVSYVISVLPK